MTGAGGKRGATAKASRRNITRLDNDRSCGWWVRIYRTGRAGKVCTSKLFSDGVNGGKRKALAAAMAWRDRALRKLRKPLRGGSPGLLDPGYGYVRRTEIVRRVESHPVWSAWIRIGGRRCKATSYSVTKWGERGAHDKAEQWLRRQRRALRTVKA